ncbi:aldo/keto reductase [Apibacter adventoris]|uniref:Oxidoreductase n=1 Tax=Apibacter adventoris TaxID=1679466 RepID=A0A2S8AAR6_9FLAO|nr:aldo/keto reductase [Apibacter adventoris]PQL91679.1 oxidoreductase [Apibacter adventoris]
MKQKTVTFRNGQQVSALGQGTWHMGKNSLKKIEEITALQTGIDLGLKVLDTAEMYNNEELVGEAIKGLRDKVFLISKVLPSNASLQGTIQACERSLKKLKTDYLDLYLLHWQGSYPFNETVSAMIKLQQEGKIKQWGVSNMDVSEMEEFFALPQGNTCAADQVAYNLQTRGIEFDLLPWANNKNMPVIAYSPIGEGNLVENKLIKEIAQKHQATSVQIALAWTIRNEGLIAIPKAGSVAHVKENYESLSIKLTLQDLELLDKLFPPPDKKIPLALW